VAGEFRTRVSSRYRDGVETDPNNDTHKHLGSIANLMLRSPTQPTTKNRSEAEILAARKNDVWAL